MTSENTSVYYYGTGKRKTAVAQVRLYPEGSAIAINGRTIEDAIPWEPWRTEALSPLRVVNMLGKFSIVAKIHGGGISAWGDALRHGIAKALLAYDPSYRSALRSYGLLTRDDRIKERKKYGLKRARRAPLYTKR